jgi:hypothetical protein
MIIYLHRHIVTEYKVILVSLQGEKKKMLEYEKYLNNPSIYEYDIMHHKLLNIKGGSRLRISK